MSISTSGSPTAHGSPCDPVRDLNAEIMADPYALYARLREAGPVHRVAGPDGRPAWIVTRYDDVRRALADPRLSLDKRRALPRSYQGFALPPAPDANLLNMDPPDHTRIRRFVTQAFSAGRVERLREPARRTAEEMLDAVARAGRADLVAAYAAPLPIAVICELLGVPAADRPDFRAWTDALIAPDPTRPEQAKEAIDGMLGYFTRLLAHKRTTPGDDLLSALISVRDEGDGRLSEDELMSLAFLILFGGYENTVQLIGNATLALLQHPEQLAALRADPTRIAAAVEEFARYDGPSLLAIRRFPSRTSSSGTSPCPPGRPCCSPSHPPIAIRSVFPSPIGSTSTVTPQVISLWAMASTTVSAHRWRGLRPR